MSTLLAVFLALAGVLPILLGFVVLLATTFGRLRSPAQAPVGMLGVLIDTSEAR